MTPRWFWPFIVLGLIAAACSGADGDPAQPAGSDNGPETETVNAADPATDAAEELAGDLVEDLESQQVASGGGSATLTVGDREWTFSSVLCAFGEDETGQEGAEFVLSSLQDGMQMYASVDSFGHFVSLDDIEDFENPKVSLSSEGDSFIKIDGKTITAEVDFTDNASDSFETSPGTFTATCP